MTPTEKRRVRVSGGELAVVDAGDPEAPPVLLVSGGFTSAHLWRELAPPLAPFLHVIAPDLLGSGDSTATDGAVLDLHAHAAAMRELLDGIGVDRFAVIGHGHGGGVAQLVAVAGGAEALVLVDSIAFDAWPGAGIRALQAHLDDLDASSVRGWMTNLLEAGMSRRERLSDDQLEEYLRPFAGNEGVARFARVASSFDGRGLEDLGAELASLEVPALVLWGEDDAILDVALAERLGDALPMASVGLLPGCGHFLLEDAAETVVPLIFQWLRSRYLRIEHRHEPAGPVTVYLGRRPPGEGG